VAVARGERVDPRDGFWIDAHVSDEGSWIRSYLGTTFLYENV
jgi:hypothetical protein